MGSRLVFKVIVVGDGGVGKSTMIQRLTTGYFVPMKITIGSDLATHNLEVEANAATLQIWDFGGEKRFRFFLPNYCRGALGCILCYDISRFKSFEDLTEWINIVKKNDVDPIYILAGQKSDLADENKRIVKVSEAEKFQKENEIDYFFETSSKTGFNNKLIFETITKAIFEKKKKIEES